VTDVDDRDPANGVVVVQEPAIEARVLAPASSLPLGEAVRVTLTRADVSARTVIFELAE